MTKPRLAVLAVLAVASAALALVGLDGPEAHELNAVFRSATNVREGLRVKIAGQDVGSIGAVHTTGANARLELHITDDRAWPLPADSTAQLRWGGTTVFASRYVELVPGSVRRRLDDGALIPLEDTVAPVEVDTVLRTFDARTRADLGALIDRSGIALRRAAPGLRSTLRATPPALQAARGLLSDLGAEPEVLDSLVRTSDHVVAAVNSASPGLDALLRDTATTFDALARESVALQQSLTDSPPTLRLTRATLASIDGTLVSARALTERLRPGVAELGALAPDLESTLRRVVSVAPLATQTLRTLRTAAPDLDALLDRVRPILPKVGAIGRRGSRQLSCVRPYGPEIAGFPSTWAGFLKNGDNADKFARVHLQSMPYPEDAPFTSEEASKLFNQTMAFPRPPGQLVGKPWFIERCGVGRDSVDPAADPEAGGG